MADRTYDSVLPWGHWMRVKPGVLHTILIDEDGREWDSLRDALFHGRLRFKAVSATFRDVELERMLAYLLSASGLTGGIGQQSTRIDMFENSDFRFFYQHWLVAEGLMSGNARAPVHESKITEEGYSIAKMLLATRPARLAMFHPGVESVLYRAAKSSSSPATVTFSSWTRACSSVAGRPDSSITSPRAVATTEPTRRRDAGWRAVSRRRRIAVVRTLRSRHVSAVAREVAISRPCAFG